MVVIGIEQTERGIEWIFEHKFTVDICPRCGLPSSSLHDLEISLVRHLSVLGFPSLLRLPRRRFDCGYCTRPFTESLPFVDQWERFTHAYEAHVFELCVMQSWSRVPELEGLTDKTVAAIYKRDGQRRLANREWTPITVLYMDELALHKGQGHYVLVLYSPEYGGVLDILPDREKETLVQWLQAFPYKEQLQAVVADMWRPYHHAVAEVCPHVMLVVDRFHVMKLLNDVITKARRKLQKVAPEAIQALLKRLRWLFVRNQDDISIDDREKLQKVFAVCPELKVCFDLRQDFYNVFETVDPETGKQRLEAWIEATKKTGFTGLQTLGQGLLLVPQGWVGLLFLLVFGPYAMSGLIGVGLGTAIGVLRLSLSGVSSY